MEFLWLIRIFRCFYLLVGERKVENDKATPFLHPRNYKLGRVSLGIYKNKLKG